MPLDTTSVRSTFIVMEASTNAVSIPTGETSDGSFWVPIALMFIGAVVGSIAVWCYQGVVSSKDNSAGTRHSGKKEVNSRQDIREFLKIFGMGIGCVALIPAFLRTISSNLFGETMTSVEARFVFVGFCVAATVSARRFLTTVPKQILDSVARTERVAERAEEKTAEVDNERLIDAVVQGASEAIRTPKDDPSYSASLSQALLTLEDHCTKNPTNAKLAVSRGVVLRRLGRVDEAITGLRNALKARRRAQIEEDRSKDGDLYYNLACYLNLSARDARENRDAEEAKKLREEAVAAFRDAVRLYQENRKIAQSDPDLTGIE